MGWINFVCDGRGAFWYLLTQRIDETELDRAIYNCTARVSVTGQSTGQSNPRRLLCCHPTSSGAVSVTLSVKDCSCGVGGINEKESHCANNCTMRASMTVPASGLSNTQ